uniref:Arginase n=1 Tax=Timema genevievae TaxID=629358 RepID=A0A7R9JWD4_TIMGE|nr:unnamed protein product [Timema genevievae]
MPMVLLWVDVHADLNTADTSPTESIHGMPVDAHADLNTADTSPTENIHGMPVALLWVDVHADLNTEDNLSEREHPRQAGGTADQEALRLLASVDPLSNLTLHVSFDIDCIDSLETPSTGAPVRGGMSLREDIQVVEQAQPTGRISAVDLVEVNPNIGDKRDVHLTIQAAEHLLQAVFGRQRRGNYPNDGTRQL